MSVPVKIDPLDILIRLRWNEGDDLEFKSAKGGLPLSLWETYVAMANTHGGIILLGVEDDGTISGVPNLAKQKKGFWDTINNRGKVSINLLTNTDVVEVPTDTRTILAIRIPQASRYQRPVFLGMNPLTGTFRRNYDGDYHCTEQEVSRMMADRAEEPADSRILEKFGLNDLDFESLQQYRQRLVSHKPTHPWLSEDDKGLLVKLGGWRRDRVTGVEGLTAAGLLMFGRDETIREAIPNYNVDYRERLSDDPNVRWTDRLTVDGTWNANLFHFFLRVVQRLSADIKLPFHLDADLFRKGETDVHEAIREALVNSLIHADYQGQGGIVVEKYHDRLEFSNPGTLLISLEQLFQGNISECRNKALQNMFMMIGVAEKAGSGVDKIRRGWQSQHWRLPIVSEQTQPDRVCWRLPMISLIPEESLVRLESLFKEQFKTFNKIEIQALVSADIEETVNNTRMRQITGEHTADITRVLQGLVAKGALVQKGQGRWSRYCLPIDSVHKDFDSVHKDFDSVHKGFDSVHKGFDSVHKDFDSVHKDIDSVHKGFDSVHKDIDSVHKDFDSVHIDSQICGEEREYLTKIAIAARKNKRLSPSVLENIILKLCENRYLTRRELSIFLGRNFDGLRSRFLTPMVEHGLLKLRYPEKPNRVDQAYTTSKKE